MTDAEWLVRYGVPRLSPLPGEPLVKAPLKERPICPHCFERGVHNSWSACDAALKRGLDTPEDSPFGRRPRSDKGKPNTNKSHKKLQRLDTLR